VTDTLVHAKARSGHGRWAISRRWRWRRWCGSTPVFLRAAHGAARDRASLGDLQRTIERPRKALAG